MKRSYTNGRPGYKKNLVKCPFCGKIFQPDGRGPPAIRCRDCKNKKAKLTLEAKQASNELYFLVAELEASRITKALYPNNETKEESKKVN